MARLGKDWRGRSARGKARQVSSGMVRLGNAGFGEAWLVKASQLWRGAATHSKVRRGRAGLGKAVMARHGSAGLGMAKQGPAGQVSLG